MDYNALAVYVDRDFIKSDGTKPLRPDGSVGGSEGNRSSQGRVLVASSTYLVPFGGTNSGHPSQTYSNDAHIKWDAVFAGTITLEAAIFPAFLGSRETPSGASVDLSDFDITTIGGWMSYSPVGTQVTSRATDATTGGATITVTAGSLTQIVVAGGTAGGAIVSVGGNAARRLRLKFTSITAGGTVRVASNGKLGS